MNGFWDNLSALWQSYVFLYIGIAVIGLILLFLISKLLSGVLWYYRFRGRNREMEQLAKDFGLSFESRLTSLFGFIFQSIFHDVQINDLQGSAQNHSIEMKDMFYSLTTLFTIAPPPLPGKDQMLLAGGNRQTIVTIDGQDAKSTWKPFSLGTSYMLTPIDDLRNFLKAQIG